MGWHGVGGETGDGYCLQTRNGSSSPVTLVQGLLDACRGHPGSMGSFHPVFPGITK